MLAIVVLSLMRSATGSPAFWAGDRVNVNMMVPEVIHSRTSEMVELKCTASGSPAPQITWYKDDLPISFGRGPTTWDSEEGVVLGKTVSHLRIPCAEAEDAGVYRCEGVAGGAVSSSSTLVNVAHHPEGLCPEEAKGGMFILSHSPSIMATQGKSINIPCNVEGSEMGQVFWTDQEGNMVSETKDLTFPSLSWEHMGVFTCNYVHGTDVRTLATFLYPIAKE